MSGPPPGAVGLSVLRWRRGEPRESRVFGPLAADHPFVDRPCPICGEVLGTERDGVLIALGVEPAEQAEKLYRADAWYSAVAVAAHARCALPGHAEGTGDARLVERGEQ